MVHRWRQKPDKAWMEKLCNVISWNLWQMDGIKGCVPAEPKPTEEQLCLFPPDAQFGLENLFGEKEEKEIGCRLFDWRRGGNGRSISYKALREKGPELMKFDFIIGNPPYQEEVKDSDNKTFMPSIYNLFMDEAFKISDRVELIHPARFLFNAGQTPKQWNEKMLSDPHFKVLHYESDGSRIFPHTEIKGGIAISYRDAAQNFGAIQVFTKFPELNSILHKVTPSISGHNLTDIMQNQCRFNLDALYRDYPKYQTAIGSNGRDKRFRNNIFEKIDLFSVEKSFDDDLAIVGVIKNKRQWRFFPKKYTDLTQSNLFKWKVLIGAASGAGVFGETLSPPLLLEPRQGYTQTYIGAGAFETKDEAEHLQQYVKTKFFRTMLGILKITQHNEIGTFRLIPLQDFTPASDIDWSKSVAEIDKQLYAKYGLDDAEIAFIESHVKEMN